MRHGSLFSGIGGFDLAAEWMGWENVFHCEWNPFGQRVLKHYWPNAESFNDITKTDFTKYYGTVDIITGGFPCQPYSSAGKRLGKEDERHLWPEMLRAIREISPSYVVGENVRGLANWNRGLVFEEVCADLENIGYQVAPCIIPACGIGAPHRRERIWFVAYSDSNARRSRSSESGREKCKTDCNGESKIYSGAYSNGNEGNVADSERNGLEHWNEARNLQTESIKTQKKGGNFTNDFEANGSQSNWEMFPTQSPICSGNDGLSKQLDGITFSNWRKESVKSYGNAIVPQVAYQIFQAIQLTDENTRRQN
jgi:DNA (cytosine-5)-methyltransferase 1